MNNSTLTNIFLHINPKNNHSIVQSLARFFIKLLGCPRSYSFSIYRASVWFDAFK